MNIQWLLDNFDVRLEKIRFGSKGLTKIFDKGLSPEMKKCCRFWPDTEKTQGFFAAKIIKSWKNIKFMQAMWHPIEVKSPLWSHIDVIINKILMFTNAYWLLGVWFESAITIIFGINFLVMKKLMQVELKCIKKKN